jgi:hypothetical protein
LSDNCSCHLVDLIQSKAVAPAYPVSASFSSSSSILHHCSVSPLQAVPTLYDGAVRLWTVHSELPYTAN